MCAKCFHAVCVSDCLNEPHTNASAGQILLDFQESIQSLFQMS